MDIAAMVGFASAGPVNLPVAVDDPGRFREIFGADPVLAWDAEAGQARYGSLGGCVESFFANGGRRCWIVRAADAATAVEHRFALPGMAEGNSDGTATEGVAARARAPGSWCEVLSVGTSLRRELVPIRQHGIDDEATVDRGPLALGPGDYRLDLIADATAFQIGELLEVYLGDDLPRLWLFVARVKPQAGFVRISGAVQQGTGHAIGAYWLEDEPGSPPDDVQMPTLVPTTEADALATLAGAGVLEALAGWPATVLNGVVSVRRLRLELGIWQGKELLTRLGDLGLAREHPRCWARLPTDAALLGSPSLSRAKREPQALDDEVRSPRFPLAGPSDYLDELPDFYLPVAVPDRLDPALARGLSQLAGTALERDGLAHFDASLFVDRALFAARGALLAEAEHLYYIRRRDLIGLHSLLPVGEVSLLAIPDAHHAGWTRQVAPAPVRLSAPELDAIPEPDTDGGYRIRWTAVTGATGYLLVRGADPDFSAPLVSYDGPDTEASLYPEPGCPGYCCLRVRARRYDELGPWSNSRLALLPGPEFVPCAGLPPSELLLALAIDDSPLTQRLTWAVHDDSATRARGYELQEATNADFIGATTVLTDATEILLAELGTSTGQEAHRYFRVRGRDEDRCGPWSRTVIVEPEERLTWTLRPVAEYDDAVLLAVHRAMLRFAAARADLVALLSLPRHYRAAEATRHVGRLTAGGDEQIGGTAMTTVVPPLGFGESQTLSFGALMHPWLSVRAPDRAMQREDVISTLPPDGAVLGSMAELAIQRGAWIAAANRVLQRVIALRPALDREDWRQLTPARVNLVLQSPRGFLLLSETTLSADALVAPIHIRRLLILLRRLALREGDRFVFAPHDINLRNLVRHRFEATLADLYARGAFAGRDPAAAFRVVTDETVNPPASMERGRFVVELQVAPAPALAFITVRLVADERGRLAVEEV
jgi:hypothetical protein